jgi:cytochrome c oxidase subunit 1
MADDDGPQDDRDHLLDAVHRLPRTFLVQHWLGAEGMPRRTISSFLLGLSVLPFMYNVWKTAKYGKKVEVDDPWGYGRSLEWATSCPPPRHNFLTLPRIRSESPAFDLHHPEVAPARIGMAGAERSLR